MALLFGQQETGMQHNSRYRMCPDPTAFVLGCCRGAHGGLCYNVVFITNAHGTVAYHDDYVGGAVRILSGRCRSLLNLKQSGELLSTQVWPPVGRDTK